MTARALVLAAAVLVLSSCGIQADPQTPPPAAPPAASYERAPCAVKDGAVVYCSRRAS